MIAMPAWSLRCGQTEQFHDLTRARGRLASAESVQLAEGRQILGDTQIRVDPQFLRRVAEEPGGGEGPGSRPAD